MPLSHQEVSDRFEIQDLLFHYADLIDRKEFDRLVTEVFTEDAHIDYSAVGGDVGGPEKIVEFLKATLGTIAPNYQHLNANIQIRVDGDRATGRVMCFNPMEMDLGEAPHTFLLGLWYVDAYERTDAGWRIARRLEEKSWVFNAPEGLNL